MCPGRSGRSMIGPPRCPAAAARGGDGQRIRRGYGPSTSPPPRRPARRRRAIRTNTYPGESCLNLHGTLFWLMGSRLCEQRALPLSANILARTRDLEGKGEPVCDHIGQRGDPRTCGGKRGGGGWSHVPSPGLRLGAGRNPATISEETSSKPTFPARACARAPATTRRRSPEGHRPDFCLELPLALLPGAGDSVGRLQAFTGSVGDLSSSPSSGCPWRLHSISRSQVEELDLGPGCADARGRRTGAAVSSSKGGWELASNPSVGRCICRP